MSTVFASMIERFSSGTRSRILGFGSSNTEHFLPGLHWFDCFELAIKNRYGRVHTCVNTGIGGHSTRDLLRRFDDDAAMYRPHMTFITIGGNDANPVNKINEKEFSDNLLEIQRRFAALDCLVVFQTYYAPDAELCDPTTMKNFRRYMDIVRETAAATGSGLIDHFARWERFRKQHPAAYRQLMQDCFHVNHRGNKVMGVDIARHFQAPFPSQDLEHWGEAFWIQQLMDQLESNANDG